MPIVALTDIKPGAVLEQPVHSPRGLLLAPAGAVLTQTHLNTFASWGIAQCTIVGQEEKDTTLGRSLGVEEIQDIQNLVEERFSLVIPLYPFMREVRRVTEEILQRRALTHDDGKGR